MTTANPVRVTYHNGRFRRSGGAYCPKHNSRSAGIGPHVNQDKSKHNVYCCFDKNGTASFLDKVDFDEHEQQLYEVLCGPALEAKNARARAKGNYSRVKTIDDYRQSNPPEETILQIGKANDEVDPNAAKEAITEFIDTMQKKYPQWRVADYALHLDELHLTGGKGGSEEKGNMSGHVHLRALWLAESVDGYVISENKCLQQMGILPPEPNRPISKFNNAKISFTRDARELFIEIVQKHGIQVETVPAYPGKRSLTREEYLGTKLRKENEQLVEANGNLAAEAAIIATERDKLAEQVVVLEEEQGRLKGILRRLRSIFVPISELFTKLRHIHLWDDKSVLDAVMEDTTCQGVVGALQELEKEDLEP